MTKPRRRRASWGFLTRVRAETYGSRLARLNIHYSIASLSGYYLLTTAPLTDAQVAALPLEHAPQEEMQP